MGKIYTIGKASKSVPFDTMQMGFCFRVNGTSEAVARYRLAEQEYPHFVNQLSQNGYEISKFQVEKDKLQKNEDGTVTIERAIQWKGNVDKKLLKLIPDLAKKFPYSLEIGETKYFISDLGKVHQELLKDALLDAKRQATFIAETIGVKIAGIENVDLEKRHSNMMTESSSDDKQSCSTEIDIVWQTE